VEDAARKLETERKRPRLLQVPNPLLAGKLIPSSLGGEVFGKERDPETLEVYLRNKLAME
jgi:hypothetical protein